MTAASLLLSLRSRGVTLTVAADRLRFRPADAVTAADLAALRAHKAALLDLLAVLGDLEHDGTAARVRALWPTITADERLRLRAEAETGDMLAGVMWVLGETAAAPAPDAEARHRGTA
jgi:hypothetical protein